MSSRKQKVFGGSFSKSIKLFNENSFTQETDLFNEQGELLICDWSTRECHKFRPLSCSIPFTTQSDADASKKFQVKKVATEWPVRDRNG